MQAFPVLREDPTTPGTFTVTGEVVQTNETDAMNRCLELATDGARYGVYVYESINPDHVTLTSLDTGPGGPPDVVDVPHVQQVTASQMLTCTMGNWTNEPVSYAYQWTFDDVGVGIGEPTCPYATEDVGKTAVCVVTATNTLGSTTAPPSNAVVIA